MGKKITEEDLNLLKRFKVRDENNQVVKFVKELNRFSYGNNYIKFLYHRKNKFDKEDYNENQDEMISTLTPSFYWEKIEVIFEIDSNLVYVRSSDNWVAKFISTFFYEEENVVKLVSIDIKKLEEDIRNNAMYKVSGMKFKDGQGVKITLNDKTGIDINEYHITSEAADFEKEHLDLLIPDDEGEKNNNTFIYYGGKLTFPGIVIRGSNSEYFKTFLSSWSVISSYVINT